MKRRALAVVAALALIGCAIAALLTWHRRRAEHEAKIDLTRRTLVALHDHVVEMHRTYPDMRDGWPPKTEYDDDGTGWWTFRHSIEGLDSRFEWRIGPKGHVLDAWDRPIHYRRPGVAHEKGWEFVSLGPDGELDTPDDLIAGEDVAPITSDEQAARDRRALEAKLAETRDALEHLADRARELAAKAALPPANGDEDSTGALLEGAQREFRDDLDGWSNALRYARPGPIHPNGWDVWSAGPNGIDERGKGDDVLTGEDVAPIRSSSR